MKQMVHDCALWSLGTASRVVPCIVPVVSGIGFGSPMILNGISAYRKMDGWMDGWHEAKKNRYWSSQSLCKSPAQAVHLVSFADLYLTSTQVWTDRPSIPISPTEGKRNIICIYSFLWLLIGCQQQQPPTTCHTKLIWTATGPSIIIHHWILYLG